MCRLLFLFCLIRNLIRRPAWSEIRQVVVLWLLDVIGRRQRQVVHKRIGTQPNTQDANAAAAVQAGRWRLPLALSSSAFKKQLTEWLGWSVCPSSSRCKDLKAQPRFSLYTDQLTFSLKVFHKHVSNFGLKTLLAFWQFSLLCFKPSTEYFFSPWISFDSSDFNGLDFYFILFFLSFIHVGV